MSKGIEIIGPPEDSNPESKRKIDAAARIMIDVIYNHSNDPRRAAIAATLIEQAAMMGIKASFNQDK